MNGRRVVAVLAALGLVAGLGYWLGSRTKPPAGNAPGSCVVEVDGRVRLDTAQMANAATITAVGVRLGMPEPAVPVALATSLQESKLRNLPHLGRRNDHDSVGLFQQRPSQGWGTAEELTDPRYAAERFYRALREVDGWQRMALTDAAQRVQRSAYPEAYAQWAGDARVLAAGLLGHEPGAVACTVPADPPARGPAAAAALGEAFTRDWDSPVTSAPTGEAVGTGQQSQARGGRRPAAGAGQQQLRAPPLAGAAAPGIAVPADGPQAGWRYAHWLVAHAAEYGVTRVRFADLVWTAADGRWSAAGGTTAEVAAEVAAG